MKRLLLIIASIIFLNVDSSTQISSFGLEGMIVRDLKIYGDTLYAATRDSGVYRRNLNDTGWVNLGLKNKLLTCIYPHPVDSQGYFLTVGAQNSAPSVIYSLSEYGWAPENIDSNLDEILALNGIESQGMTSMMFAGGSSSSVYSLARRSNIVWQIVPNHFEGPYITEINVSQRNEVWIGGGGGVAFVFKSTDKGDSWTFVETIWPYGIWCEDIEFDPFDPDIVYIIMWDMQKSTDGGLTWQRVGEVGNELAINPFNGNQLFSGSSYYGWLFETTDGGLNWDTIPSPEGADYISDLEINLYDSLELYIATEGTGVYRLTQPSSACGRLINVNEGWNMLSVPNRVHNFSKNTLLPSSISSAFTYENSYISKDTLENGTGYWSKFNSSEVIRFIGEKITSDSIDVDLGWNMIGSISYPVRVSSIGIDPPDMIVSEFFAYKDNQYVSSDTIQPGHAYWVKINKSGKLILDTTSSMMTSMLIKIVPDGELPPPPPGEQQIKLEELPKKFALEQNYPNPFNPSTVISYQLPAESWVTLKVYNIFGQEIITLVNSVQQAGYKSAQFDAKAFASGVYFYHLHTVGIDDPKRTFSYVKKMIVLK